MQINVQWLHFILVLPLLVASSMNAMATTFTIPRSQANVEGNVGDLFHGFLGTITETSLFQVAESELEAQGLTVGDTIIGVRARRNGRLPVGPAGITSWPEFTVKLGQAAFPVDSMSTQFASNMINPVTVRSGAYSLSTTSMPSGSVPNAFGPLVTFSSPYVYQGGDLAIYYSHDSATGPSLEQDADNSGTGTLYRRLLTDGYNAPRGFLTNVIAVMQFEVVPEPLGIVPLLSAAMAYGSIFRRRVPSR